MWDSAGRRQCRTIRTEKGWLEVDHGANAEHKYCLGGFLMELDNPSKVISRTIEPIMVPTEL